MTSPAASGLLDFLDRIWGEHEGYVYLPVKEQTSEGLPKVRKFFHRWPEKREAVARHILKWSAVEGVEVFFSPALYASMSAKNTNVLGSQVAWAEFDGNFPTEWPESVAPVPTIEVQSSAARNRHAYWLLDTFVERKQLETINRSLSYALNADTSGWDANQFLRPPFSVHRKGRPITVKVVTDREELAPYPLSDFSHIPVPLDVIQEKIDVDNLPSIEDVRSLATWDEDLLELFDTTGEDARKTGWDRSGGLARIAYKGAELSWSDEQILSALLDADDRWGKYKGRQTRMKILEELINRARAKIGYSVSSDKQLLSKLLNDPERPVIDDDLPDFMSIGQINAIPGRDDWTVEGLLTKHGLGLCTGRPGTGKTQLMMQLAASLATGRDEFLDYKLTGKPMKVLFLSLEMSAYQLQHFTSPLAERYPEPELDENLIVYGKGEPVYMNQEAGQRLVDSWLDEYKPDVVIVDSLSQATTDLSSDDEMSKLFAFLKALRRYHSFGMIFIHHHRKKANDAQSRKQANTQSDIYGSYQIAATIDFALDLEDRGDENGYLDLHLLKARFRPVGDPEKVMRDDKLHFHLTENLGLLKDQIMQSPDENGDSHAGPGLQL